TTYTYGHNARVTQVAIQADSAGTAFATTTIAPWDEVGLTTLVLADTAGPPTTINGPIPGNGDVAQIWVDRFGQAKRTKHVALNTITRIWRDSSQTLPVLVTRIDRPHPATPGAQGSVVRLAWNARGNLVSQRDSSSHLGAALGLPTSAVTYTYGSSTAPDSPTLVTDALGRSVNCPYDSLGFTASTADARGHVTEFVHEPSGSLKGALRQVKDGSVPTWNGTGNPSTNLFRRFTYDAAGNLKTDSLPTGVRHLYVTDAFGRVTEAYDPIGTRTTRAYDALNRVTSITQYKSAQAIPGSLDLLAGCDTTQVVCGDRTAASPGTFPASLTTLYFHG